VTTPSQPRHVSNVIEERRRVWPLNVNQGLLLLRLIVGLLFVGHASQKLFGWFGGTGMADFIATVAKLGLNPPVFWANLEAFAELVGGLFLALGLLTPFAAAAIIGDMLVAIVKVHAPKGLWSQSGGYEYNVVLITILVAIGIVGPGLYSLDRRLPFTLPRPLSLIVALLGVLVVVGAALVGLL
jgi:putative oxidoreductase